MSNPVLNRAFGNERSVTAQELPSNTGGPIVADDRMSASGVARASVILFAIFGVTAVWGWNQVDIEAGTFPGWLLPALLIGIGAAILGAFKPAWARVIGPIYAVVEGALVGAISASYASAYDGIVTNAILATFVTVVVMAVLYVTRTIRVTERMRSIIMGATVAVFAFYLLSLGLSFFGVQMPLIWDAGILGIGFSLAVIALAAFNLLLDFDLIERGVKGGAPAYMDWYAGFGLLVTVVWLYLEILRLLSKLQRR